MTEHTTIQCPECHTELVTTRMTSLQSIRCAACRATFILGAVGQQIRTSGKARASLVLGIASFCGLLFSGIPAVILGVLALRDIRRQPGTLRGRGYALTGILSGSVLGLGTSLFVVTATAFGIWLANSTERTKEAGRIQEIASTMGEFDVPQDIPPQSAMTFMGVTIANYADVDDQAEDRRKIFLIHYKDWMFRDRKLVRAQMSSVERHLGGTTVESSERWLCQVSGVEVTELVRSDEDNTLFRNYIAAVPARQGNVLAIIVIKQPPGSEAKPRMSKDEVRQFLESFKAE